MKKICTKCKKKLPLSAFVKRGADGTRAYCKACHAKIQKRYRRKRMKDEAENVTRLCKCGCGELAKPGRHFIQGHDSRVINPSARKAVRIKIGLAIKEKWQDPEYRKNVLAGRTKS